MNTTIRMPLDTDGYLRRACPFCEREFKWLPQDNGLPTPIEGYHCPYCGHTADEDAWWTEAQLAYAQAHAANLATDVVNKALRGLNTTTGSLRVTVAAVRRQPVTPLTEPNDMHIVTPLCHPSESVKLGDGWTNPAACLHCGQWQSAPEHRRWSPSPFI